MASIDDGWVMGYDIFRDGVLVKEQLDANSFFDSNLEPATTYQYSVVAVDDKGNRSVPSEVELTTSDGLPLSPDTLVAPQIERIEVYSGTAAKLFWRQPPPGSLVARVEVSRDNVVLGTTDDTSYFDDSRSPGVDYVYSLIAIAADGRRSDDDAPDPGDGGDRLDVIRTDNVVTLIAAVFDVYRGEPWGNIVFALPGFTRTPDLTPNEEQTLTCANGGTVTIRRINTGYGGGPGFVFDNCQDGATLFDGQVDNYRDRYGTQHVQGTGITITAQTETIRYSGHVFELPGSLELFIYSSGPVDFEKSAADGTLYSLAGAVTHFQYGTTPTAPWPTVSLSGSFALASGRTGGLTLRVETPETLRFPTGFNPETEEIVLPPDDWTFTEGSLRITAPDRSTVLLEADNGDETSALLTLIDSSGESATFDEPWSVWQENLRFD